MPENTLEKIIKKKIERIYLLRKSISLRTTLQDEATIFADLETYFKTSSPIKLNNYYLGVINTPYIESRATTGNNIQDTNYGLFPQSSLTDVSVKNGETKAYNNLFNPIKTQTGPDDKWPFVGNNGAWLKTRMADGAALTVVTLYTIGNEFGIQPDTKVWGTNFKALFYKTFKIFVPKSFANKEQIRVPLFVE